MRAEEVIKSLSQETPRNIRARKKIVDAFTPKKATKQKPKPKADEE